MTLFLEGTRMEGHERNSELDGVLGVLGDEIVLMDLDPVRIRYASPSVAARLGSYASAVWSASAMFEVLPRFVPDPKAQRRVFALFEQPVDGAVLVIEYAIEIEGRERFRRATLRVVPASEEYGRRLLISSSDITDLVDARRAGERARILGGLVERLEGATEQGLERVAEVLADEVRNILDADACGVCLFEDQGHARTKRLATRGGAPLDDAETLQQEAEQQLRRGGPLVHFVAKDRRVTVVGAGKSAGTLLGCIAVIESQGASPPEPSRIALISAIADAIVAPIARATIAGVRIRNEEKTRLAKHRLRAALEATRTGIWEIDLQAGTLEWDSRCFELWERDPALGADAHWVLSHLSEKEREEVEAGIGRALDPRGDGVFEVEYVFNGPSDKRRWIGARGQCAFDSEGRPGKFIGTVVDITERKEAQAAQLESERRYRHIVETMDEGVGVLDADGFIRFVNAAYTRMFGFADERELLGRHVGELMFEEDRERERERWMEHVAHGGGPTRAVRRFRRADGHEVWVSLASVPMTDGSILGVATDITAARRLEAKLQQTQKLESLGVLAGGIAHDFNNLLVGVLGNVGLARVDLPKESPALEAIGEIETAAVRASELTRQLLAYAGKGRFVITRIDLRKLVDEMGHLLSAVIGKGVTLRYQFGDAPPVVEGDATQLRQVIMNLITNASDAIGDQSGIVTVATSLVQADRAYLSEMLFDDELAPGLYVSLQISDTGGGMSPETRDRIFDPFFTTKFTGRGLGLAAVLGIMRAHRGAIKVYSEIGRGTTFKMLLPAVSGAADSLTRPPTPHHPPTRPGLVLVVDDEASVRTVVKRLLEGAGYTVVTAADGQEGVEVFRANHPHVRLVILDVTMPRMGGEEAFRRLRQLDPEVRVVLSSGYSEQEATSQFAGKGLAGFLEKPFRAEALFECVRLVAGEGGS